jgi:hypothetical protein
MNVITQSRNILLIGLTTALILLVPLVAMQFTGQVDWEPGDFAAAAVLLFGTGLTFELVTRNRSNMSFRAVVGIVLAAALLLVWAQLAVGIWD